MWRGDTQRNYLGGVMAAAGSAQHASLTQGSLSAWGGFKSGAGQCWGRPSATPTSSSRRQDVRGAGLEPSPRVAGRHHQVAGKSPREDLHERTSTGGPQPPAGHGGAAGGLQQPPPLRLLSLPRVDLHLRDQNQPHGLGAHGLPDQGPALLHRHQGQVSCGHRGWDRLQAPFGAPSVF